jgi:hypothetical protein
MTTTIETPPSSRVGPKLNRKAAASIILGVVALILLVGNLTLGSPSVTCHLADHDKCTNTATSIAGSFEVFYPPLTHRLKGLDLRTAPPEWAQSADPGFAAAEWAAFLEVDGAPPILAACYYSSDTMVTCDTQEGP